jgi:hypothetical protein
MLDELEFDHKVFQSAEADKNLAVRFYLHPLQNDEETEKQHRPIFNDVEFIEIRVRGDKNNTVQRPARDDDKRRFRDAYKAFQAGEEQALSGTPLKEWPSMTKSMLEELKYMGFFTVEQLAGATDGVCSKFAGLMTWKQKAQLFLEFAKGAPAIDALQARVEAAENEREVQARQLQELLAANQRMEAQIEALQGKKVK